MPGIEWDMGGLTVNAKTLGPRLNRGISGIMLSQAPRVQDYARSNAKWRDQTGNARQGLFARYSGGQGTHTIELYHTVNYGIWLEVRWAGRYAIIGPTINIEGQRIMGMMKNLIDKLAAA